MSLFIPVAPGRLPQLPAPGELWADAVISVYDRGFHENLPEKATDAALMAQYGRLVEEVGELDQAYYEGGYGTESYKSAVMDELADIWIVAAQMCWLLKIRPSPLEGEAEVKDVSITAEIGNLWRAFRKQTEAEIVLNRLMGRVSFQAEYLFNRVGEGKQAFHDRVRQKIAADEQRGQLHGGCPCWPSIRSSRQTGRGEA